MTVPSRLIATALHKDNLPRDGQARELNKDVLVERSELQGNRSPAATARPPLLCHGSPQAPSQQDLIHDTNLLSDIKFWVLVCSFI